MRRSGDWEARRWATKAIRAFAFLAPLACAAAVSIVAARRLPAATSTFETCLRTTLLCVLSIVTLRLIDNLARRSLPLATLLQLSIVFPDRAPSRFKMALRSGSSRRIAKVVEQTRHHGLDDDPARAAEQVVLLATALNDHDRRTRGHSERVRLYADMIGEEMGLKRDERRKLQWAALLHDIGKLHTPTAILNKPGKLSADEWATMQEHAAHGAQLVQPLEAFLGEWLYGIADHHEKWDGTGYPKRLKGDEIPRAACIVALADSFEVMTAVRSYKKALSLKEARLEVTRCAGTHFSPDVVRAFLSISIGRIRTTMGPIAALAHLPFVSALAQTPAAVASAVSASSAPLASMAVPALIATGAVTVERTPPTMLTPPVPAIESVPPTVAGQPLITAWRAGGSGSAEVSVTVTLIPSPGERSTSTVTTRPADPSASTTTQSGTTQSGSTTTRASTTTTSPPDSTAPPSPEGAAPTTSGGTSGGTGGTSGTSGGTGGTNSGSGSNGNGNGNGSSGSSGGNGGGSGSSGNGSVGGTSSKAAGTAARLR